MNPILSFDDTDLGAPDTYATGPPHTAWARRRTAGPVVRDGSPALGRRFWSVTGWSAARELLGRPEDFSSRYGMVLGYGPDCPDPAGQQMISACDAPQHTHLRALMHGYFTPRWARTTAQALEDALRTRLAPLLRTGEPFDFARDIAGHLPMEAACLILGLPPHDRDELYALATSTLSGTDPDSARDHGVLTTATAHAELFTYFLRLTRVRRGAGDDDMIRALATARAPEPLTDQEVAANCVGVLIAATETTRLALAGAGTILAAHPDIRALLSGSAEQLRTTGEEILRWTSPATHVLRTATHDTTLAGYPIAAGDLAVAWLGAANRDAHAFDRPGVFDPARTPNRHMAFGHGPHHCIGATVARIELATTLRILHTETTGVELLGPPTHLRSIHTSGYKSLPLRLLARRPDRARLRPPSTTGLP
ncbi:MULTISPECIES: cytochrome P450 [Streptomyces]|uniref:Cytochrome P450 n=1 Tax=Streptomyces tsukubensis (strain DSM 42081 / NBRC 108919 / NRRL 18488 / 9993) TaxID=1114943 RepID=I2NB43_STRT9|nr:MULTISPECIES: cytochrome P450 [Streptomyces]AZK97985.1 cytochrome P450 [Streptomyces tsukubensis]EIF94240.1 cytochrome P450 [Streptomyces tsukubensis NRRL18488]MYS64441.1 cytochrome P450 [Streptomyces sp. SID5473]QKM66091.1 cytochrome P450 [Streptomyces tsukubensis NRRL18488]TAI42373.1 cytochrome P450 [Streptomyces tsukubensis]